MTSKSTIKRRKLQAHRRVIPPTHVYGLSYNCPTNGQRTVVGLRAMELRAGTEYVHSRFYSVTCLVISFCSACSGKHVIDLEAATKQTEQKARSEEREA